MSSVRSRGMGLRGLVLGGAVSGISTLSGCIAAAHYIAEHDAAVIEANATRDAANTMAGRNNYNYNNLPNQFFACNYFLNKGEDAFEALGRKDNFCSGEKVTLVTILNNLNGSYLTAETVFKSGDMEKRKTEFAPPGILINSGFWVASVDYDIPIDNREDLNLWVDWKVNGNCIGRSVAHIYGNKGVAVVK